MNASKGRPSQGMAFLIATMLNWIFAWGLVVTSFRAVINAPVDAVSVAAYFACGISPVVASVLGLRYVPAVALLFLWLE